MKKNDRKSVEDVKDFGEKPPPKYPVVEIVVRLGEGLARNSSDEPVSGWEVKIQNRRGLVVRRVFEDRRAAVAMMEGAVGMAKALGVVIDPPSLLLGEGESAWSAVLPSGRRRKGFTREPIAEEPKRASRPLPRVKQKRRFRVRFV